MQDRAGGRVLTTVHSNELPQLQIAGNTTDIAYANIINIKRQLLQSICTAFPQVDKQQRTHGD